MTQVELKHGDIFPRGWQGFVIKRRQGVPYLEDYSLGGWSLIQFHNDDFQAVNLNSALKFETA